MRFTEKDLVFTSPVTKANVARGAMSIDALYRAILVESDNTAAILLMRSAGGPAALTRFLRGLGDTVTRARPCCAKRVWRSCSGPQARHELR